VNCEREVMESNNTKHQLLSSGCKLSQFHFSKFHSSIVLSYFGPFTVSHSQTRGVKKTSSCTAHLFTLKNSELNLKVRLSGKLCRDLTLTASHEPCFSSAELNGGTPSDVTLTPSRCHRTHAPSLQQGQKNLTPRRLQQQTLTQHSKIDSLQHMDCDCVSSSWRPVVMYCKSVTVTECDYLADWDRGLFKFKAFQVVEVTPLSKTFNRTQWGNNKAMQCLSSSNTRVLSSSSFKCSNTGVQVCYSLFALRSSCWPIVTSWNLATPPPLDSG
jgi:hypothetical protein